MFLKAVAMLRKQFPEDPVTGHALHGLGMIRLEAVRTASCLRFLSLFLLRCIELSILFV